MANRNPIACFAHMIKLAVSNHNGTGHKVAHNITTLANIPLVAWFIYAVLSLRGADYDGLTQFIAQPCNLIMSILFVIVPLTHFTLEIEVVYEDYISDVKRRNVMIKLMKAVFIIIGVATIASILKVGL